MPRLDSESPNPTGSQEPTYSDASCNPNEQHLKLGARYYNPTTGRFTQPDPSGQEPNTYAYASDNPTNLSDPTGLDGFGTAFNILGLGAALETIGFLAEGTAIVAGTLGVGAAIVVGGVAVLAVAALAITGYAIYEQSQN